MTLSKREMRSIELLLNNNVKQLDPSKFIVYSQSDQNRFYEVIWYKKKWICSCRDFAKRKKVCKHIYAVRYYMLLQSITTEAKNYKDRPYCPKCNSDDFIIKRGFRYNKCGPVQRYFCKRCKIKFTDRSAFKGMKNKVAAIVSALDLYFRGISLRQLAEHLELTYGVKVSHATIYNWIKKYVQLVNKYISKLKVKASSRWHMDDTMLKVSGRHMVLWTLLDSETRFLLALQISGKRGAEEAQRLIQKGLNSAENMPSELISDGLDSYRIAIEKEAKSFRKNKIIHIHGPLTTGFNNKVERLHGLLKNRVKTMCRLQNEETAEVFVKGFETYYNYIKSHKALHGLTPAQAAGITSNKESWLKLILDAEKHNE